jgi:hypothetical protein
MTTSPSSPRKESKAGPTLFIIMLVIIVGSFLLFLIFRPKSSPDTVPHGNSPTSATQQ